MKNLAILNEAQGPWTFEKDASGKNGPVMIGTSANDYLFGYSLDSQNQIKKILASCALTVWQYTLHRQTQVDQK